MSSLFGDDPDGVAVLVHADDGASPLAGLVSDGLDQRVAADEAEEHRGLRRRVQHVLLEPEGPSTPAFVIHGRRRYRRQPAVMPPSLLTTVPWMLRASSEARNANSDAMSSGVA